MLSIAGLSWPLAASAGTPRYPDLKMLPPSDVQLGQTTVNGTQHHVVRFTSKEWNAGEGPVELHITPHVPLDGWSNVTQRIYEDPVGFRDEPVTTMSFDPTHPGFAFQDSAKYELWSRRAFDVAQATGFRWGRPLYVNQKVSYCLYDDQQVDPNASPGVYRICTPVAEGISPGWADVYEWSLLNQWVDVGTSPLPDGKYVVRFIADPSNLLFESPGKADPARESQVANSSWTYFSIVNGQLIVG